MRRVFELSTRVKAISRGRGKDGKRQPRSVTAAAAYRACCVIDCEREGTTHDYTRKRGLEVSRIVLPDHAPAWAADRAKLWNGAELRERNGKRGKNPGAFKVDAQTAREFMFSFPAELSAAGRLKAAETIARHLVDTHGVAADFSIHLPGREGDERNHHCHMLTTTRRMTAIGLGRKAREWDELDNAPVLAKRFRAFVAQTLNDALKEEGQDGAVHVEHQSYKARGSGQVATRHQGPFKTHNLRKQQQRARAAWQARERKGQTERHAKDRADLKTRQESALQAKLAHLAERERAGIKAIRDELVKAQAADTAPKGASRVFQTITGQAMRADFDRQTRHVQRAQAAAQAMEGLKREVQAERHAFVTGQHRDRDALTERHAQEDRQFKQAVTARHDYDRAAEQTARREEVRGLEREGPGRGRDFSP